MEAAIAHDIMSASEKNACAHAFDERRMSIMSTGKEGKRNAPLHRILAADASRVFGGPVFWAVILFGTVFKVLACFEGTTLLADLMNGSRLSAVYYLDDGGSSGYMVYAVICLCALPAASIYAEEKQKNALLMRLQRMGAGKYVWSRTVYAVTSAWICMVIIDLLTLWAVSVPLGQGLFTNAYNWGWSNLLEGGHLVAYTAIVITRNAMEAVFYTLLTMGVSAFLTNRQALVAIPLVFRFAVFIYTTPLPDSLLRWSPRFMYGMNGFEARLLGITETACLAVMCLYTLAAAIICGGILYLRIRKGECA